MRAKKGFSLLVLYFLFFVGCDSAREWYEGSEDYHKSAIVHASNETGHDIYISLTWQYSTKKSWEYVKNGKDIYLSTTASFPLVYIEAFKEEFDATGKVIWKYWHSDSETVRNGDNFTKHLTVEINDYKDSESYKYPVMPTQKLTLTNKTDYKLIISEFMNAAYPALTLNAGETGEVTINQLITDDNSKSFYFWVVNGNTIGYTLRMTFSRSFLRTHNAVDIPPKLIATRELSY